jgi:hypothetical protein
VGVRCFVEDSILMEDSNEVSTQVFAIAQPTTSWFAQEAAMHFTKNYTARPIKKPRSRQSAEMGIWGKCVDAGALGFGGGL